MTVSQKISERNKFTETCEEILERIDNWYDERGIKPEHNASAKATEGHNISNTTLYASFGQPGSGKTYSLNKVLEQLNPEMIFFINPNHHLDQTINIKDLPCKYIQAYKDIKEGFLQALKYLILRLDRISLQEKFTEFKRLMNDPTVLIPKEVSATILQEIDEEWDMFDEISIDEDYWDKNKLITVVFDDCGSKRKDLDTIQDAFESAMASRRHIAMRVLMNLQGLTQFPLKNKKINI